MKKLIKENWVCLVILVGVILFLFTSISIAIKVFKRPIIEQTINTELPTSVQILEFSASFPHLDIASWKLNYNPMKATVIGEVTDFYELREKFKGYISSQGHEDIFAFCDYLHSQGKQVELSSTIKEVYAFSSRSSGHPCFDAVMYLDEQNKFKLYIFGV